jgi:hypothetical protein
MLNQCVYSLDYAIKEPPISVELPCVPVEWSPPLAGLLERQYGFAEPFPSSSFSFDLLCV